MYILFARRLYICTSCTSCTSTKGTSTAPADSQNTPNYSCCTCTHKHPIYVKKVHILIYIYYTCIYICMYIYMYVYIHTCIPFLHR